MLKVRACISLPICAACHDETLPSCNALQHCNSLYGTARARIIDARVRRPKQIAEPIGLKVNENFQNSGSEKSRFVYSALTKVIISSHFHTKNDVSQSTRTQPPTRQGNQFLAK